MVYNGDYMIRLLFFFILFYILFNLLVDD